MSEYIAKPIPGNHHLPRSVRTPLWNFYLVLGMNGGEYLSNVAGFQRQVKCHKGPPLIQFLHYIPFLQITKFLKFLIAI